MSNNKLTDKQTRFSIEYMKDLNATQAAIRAGYSKKTAGQIGEQNLKKLEIQKFIESLKKEVKKRCEVESDDITSFFLKVMEDSKEKTTDRIKAAENLAKRIGFYEMHNEQKAIPKQRPRITFGESD